MSASLGEVSRVYQGSDGEATKALYARLEALGVDGELAVNLLRAVKNSTRAKLYRGRSNRGAAYDTKGWAMGNICRLLLSRAGDASVRSWGWAIDEEQSVHRHVLYVDLPTGQVSFHSEYRGQGPDYAGGWDGSGISAARIVAWAANVLDRRAGERELEGGASMSLGADSLISEKVDYVLDQCQTREHHCHWPGCTRQVPPAVWGCKEHWQRLPQAIRRKIWRAYQPGQERTGTPSPEYVAAAGEARAWCLEQERQAAQGRLL